MLCLNSFVRLRSVLLVGSLLFGVLGTSASAQNFDLEFNFVMDSSDFSTSQFAVFDQVETQYESLLTGYQPTVSNLTGATIDVTLGAIDGPINFDDGTGGTIGEGGGSLSPNTPNGGFQFFVTNGSQTTGFLELDEADIDTVEGFGGDALFTLIFHEVGHALGFGTLWDENNLVDTSGQYTGFNGLTAFQQEFGPVLATTIPTDGTAPGNAGHWDENSVLGDDVLSPSLLLGGTGNNPISQTTVASFADLGYTVAIAVPEPTSAGLLALGGCMLASRRRRARVSR